MKTWKDRAHNVIISAGRLALDIAPIVTVLGRGSHPIAWAAAGLFATHKIYVEVMGTKPRPWDPLPFSLHHAILELARTAEIGTVLVRYNGGEERIHKGVIYGSGQGWIVGPYGDPTAIVDAIWEKYGGIKLNRDSALNSNVTLAGDRRVPKPPAALVESLAADCVALRRSGAGVGLLIDGPPGTGKSQALLHVAAKLGGRTLRTTLKTASPEDMLSIATAMAAEVVVLDDIDRGPTDGALDAVEQLLDRGVAVLASANVTSEICAALLRDGRIDDHRTFGVVEPDVLDRLIAEHDLEPEVVEQLRACTVASVRRYLQRRQAWGPEKAMAKLRPLVAEAVPPA